MSPQEALHTGIRLIKGLAFADDAEFMLPTEVYKAFISPSNDAIPTQLIPTHFTAQFATLLTKCLDHVDVYERSTWDSPHLLSNDNIENVISLVMEARRRYLQNPDANSNEADLMIRPLDKLIAFMNTVDKARAQRGRPKNLTRPENGPFPRSGTVWPPTCFRPLNIAVLGEQSVREKLYGFDRDYTAKEKIKPLYLYPHDQYDPIDIRHYLSWLALATQDDQSKVSLFLNPIAFLTHEERQNWYESTGHKSRYYATVHDFVDYAAREISSHSEFSKNHVLALATPWFFDIEYPKREAERRHQDVPAVWQQICFRAGLAICLSKAKWLRRGYEYRLVIFKPGPPMYPRAAERADRRPKQEIWISEVISIIKARFNVPDTWLDGSAEQHELPDSAREVQADSVESSAEFLTEMMEDHENIPLKDDELINRGFTFWEPSDDSE
ncbi:hypothetical protein F5Y12DRAFT_716896 [Xylaria sp. FL1777]|nr:hypothetical protein F5Y12DRAFT_716896 [Xylaria sp. FL1777]